MKTHFELSDLEFETQFRKCTLPPQIFSSHEAHLRLAWIHIKKYGIEQACDHLCEQILRFDQTFDKGDKFHYTLTVAAARVVYHFMLKSNASTFAAFIQEFPRVKTHFKELLDQHYQVDIFNSEEARVRYVEPDLVPFD